MRLTTQHLSRRLALAGATLGVAVPSASAAPPVFMPMGVAKGYYNSTVDAMSADGSTLLGSFTTEGMVVTSIDYVWTAQSGFRILQPVSGHDYSSFSGLSATGATISGISGFPNPQPIKWINGFPLPIPLPLPPGASWGRTHCISGDGQVIYGSNQSYAGVSRWRNNTVTHIGNPPTGTNAVFGSTTFDGGVAVGSARAQNRDFAIRWTEATGFMALGMLPGGDTSQCSAVSEDGAVVVGSGSSSVGPRGWRWTQQSGMVPLPSLATHTQANYVRSMNGDGSVIGGDCHGSGFERATLWRDGLAIDLKELLVSRGLDLDGWNLRMVTGISADARYIAGFATVQTSPTRYHHEGFLVYLPCDPDLSTSAVPGSPGYGKPNGSVTNEDFFYYLLEFSAANLAVADLTATAIPGSAGYGVPNGVINNDDFFYFLSLFVAGC